MKSGDMAMKVSNMDIINGSKNETAQLRQLRPFGPLAFEGPRSSRAVCEPPGDLPKLGNFTSAESHQRGVGSCCQKTLGFLAVKKRNNNWGFDHHIYDEQWIGFPGNIFTGHHGIGTNV